MSEPIWEELSLQELGDVLWSRAYQQGKNVGFCEGYKAAVATLKSEAGVLFTHEQDAEAKSVRKMAKSLESAAPSLDSIRALNGDPNDYPVRVELARRDAKQQEGQEGASGE